MKWEYAKQITHGQMSVATMDFMGSKGWELVAVVHSGHSEEWVYKRPLITDEAQA